VISNATLVDWLENSRSVDGAVCYVEGESVDDYHMERFISVPLSVGLNDEHRHQLLRVARKLETPLLCTDAKRALRKMANAR
jgi:hypothetical protein